MVNLHIQMDSLINYQLLLFYKNYSAFSECYCYTTYFTLVGGVSSAVLSSVTPMFWSKDALVHFLMLSMYFILGRPFLLFPGIIPRMHVFTSLHLLFLHACPKKAIFRLIIWARSSCLEVHPVCSCFTLQKKQLK